MESNESDRVNIVFSSHHHSLPCSCLLSLSFVHCLFRIRYGPRISTLGSTSSPFCVISNRPSFARLLTTWCVLGIQSLHTALPPRFLAKRRGISLGQHVLPAARSLIICSVISRSSISTLFVASDDDSLLLTGFFFVATAKYLDVVLLSSVFSVFCFFVGRALVVFATCLQLSS